VFAFSKTLFFDFLVLPLYFDHKIANEFGSYPEIYTKIIKNQPSRYQIERLESILEKKYRNDD